MKRADTRPRVHIWPHDSGFYWSFGPVRSAIDGADVSATEGEALGKALISLGASAHKGVVVIVEPLP